MPKRRTKTAMNITATKPHSIRSVRPATATPASIPMPTAGGKKTAVRTFVQTPVPDRAMRSRFSPGSEPTTLSRYSAQRGHFSVHPCPLPQ